MNLHEHKEDFTALATIVSREKNIPESAVIRDYYIVFMLEKLAKSSFADKCVFKGGTSLSKCYPDSIERFSEDIDLTYLGMEEDDNTCDKALRGIIAVMTIVANVEKIPGEGNKRSKSRRVWFDNKDNGVKLEIGSTVRPDPYAPKTVKTYIQEYLEKNNMLAEVEQFGLREVTINTLAIERTFIDKVMSVKRHAICGTLNRKVRHIYDVVRLYQMDEIKSFLKDKVELKRILRLTKETDSYYLQKRDIAKDYNPIGAYDFDAWKGCFNDDIKAIYENLHKDLLYTNEPQDFDLAVKTFEELNRLFASIDE
jgi:predicted nucleotidyltransferase component of viral defense system